MGAGTVVHLRCAKWLHGVRMKPQDRYDWIENDLRTDAKARGGTDVLDSDFVDRYIEATGAAFRVTNFGAFKCPQLGRDLAAMTEQGILKRNRIGIEGMAGMGFPRWVWSYRLTRG